MNCKFCGAELPASKGKRKREYCSDTHRQAYFRQHKKAPVQHEVDQTGLEARVSELEQTIARMQEQAEIDHKLSSKRIDILEKSIIDLRENLLPQLVNALSREDSTQDQRLNKLIDRIIALETSREETSDFNQKLEASRARTKHMVEREKAKDSVSTPESIELADFSQLMQHEYRSSATRGDVKAWLTLRPNPQGKSGDYSIDYWSYDKADKKGAMKRDQKERGEQLKQDLKTDVLKALGLAGWKEIMYGVYACPEGKQQ